MAFVMGAFGVTAAMISASLAIGTPRASRTPVEEPGGVVSCAELPEWRARTVAQGHTSRVRVRDGEVIRDRRSRELHLVCGEAAYRLDAAGALDTRGGVLVRLTTWGGLVLPRASLGPNSPRANAEAAHLQGAIAGVLGALLLVAAWASRPFDPLRDAAGRRARRDHRWWSEPSSDRVRIAGVELSHRFLGAGPDGLVPVAGGEGPHLGLPGAEARYREGAGGGPYVQGPAKVNGLRVPSGVRVPVGDGDRVALGGAAAVQIQLPRPGALVRYLVQDDALRAVARIRDGRSYRIAASAFALGALAAVTAHLDLPYRAALALPLLGLALAVAWRVPPKLSRAIVTRIDLDAVRRGERRLSVREEGSLGRALLLDGEVVGRLPEPSSAERSLREERRWLVEALDRELDVLRG